MQGIVCLILRRPDVTYESPPAHASMNEQINAKTLHRKNRSRGPIVVERTVKYADTAVCWLTCQAIAK